MWADGRGGMVSTRAAKVRIGCFIVGIATMLMIPVAFVAVVVFLIFNPFRTAELETFTGEARARVISAETTTWESCSHDGPCREIEGYNVVYRYEARGAGYEATEERWRHFAPQQEPRVCYDPEEPARHSITQAEDACGDQFWESGRDAERVE